MLEAIVQSNDSDFFRELGDFIIGSGFLLGIIVMNIPQHYLCIKHRSADGLSLAYILLCTISNATLFLASFANDYEWISKTISARNSTEGLLIHLLRIGNACMPSIQNLLSLLIGVPCLLVYYFWFSQPQAKEATTTALPAREEDVESNAMEMQSTEHEPLLKMSTKSFRRYSTDSVDTADLSFSSNESYEEPLILSQPAAVISARMYYSDGTESEWAKKFTLMTWLVVGLAFCLSGMVLFGSQSNYKEATTAMVIKVLGSTAASTNVILFIPQIVTTYRNQHEGVLSLLSLIISVVGDVALGGFWTFSDGESMWVVIACVADASMQLIFIEMILNFRYQRQWQQQQEESQGPQEILRAFDDTTTTTSHTENNAGE